MASSSPKLLMPTSTSVRHNCCDEHRYSSVARSEKVCGELRALWKPFKIDGIVRCIFKDLLEREINFYNFYSMEYLNRD